MNGLSENHNIIPRKNLKCPLSQVRGKPADCEPEARQADKNSFHCGILLEVKELFARQAKLEHHPLLAFLIDQVMAMQQNLM
jgi:hypothetical protein